MTGYMCRSTYVFAFSPWKHYLIDIKTIAINMRSSSSPFLLIVIFPLFGSFYFHFFLSILLPFASDLQLWHRERRLSVTHHSAVSSRWPWLTSVSHKLRMEHRPGGKFESEKNINRWVKLFWVKMEKGKKKEMEIDRYFKQVTAVFELYQYILDQRTKIKSKS